MNTEHSSRTPPERTGPTAMRFATVAHATSLRCVLATGTARSPVPVTPSSAHRLVAEPGPDG